MPFFAFPPAIRKMIYTTDEIDKPSFTWRDSFLKHRRPRGEEQVPRSLIIAPPLRRPCARIGVGAAASG